MTDTVEQELLSFIASRVASGAQLATDTDLLEDELLDSLLIMDVVAHMEGRYGVRLENTDIAPANFRTVERLAGLIAARRRPR
jgi:acyl carrier protein